MTVTTSAVLCAENQDRDKVYNAWNNLQVGILHTQIDILNILDTRSTQTRDGKEGKPWLVLNLPDDEVMNGRLIVE